MKNTTLLLTLLVHPLAFFPLACGGSSGTAPDDGDQTTGGTSSTGGSETGGTTASGGSNGLCANCTQGCCDGDTCIPFSSQANEQCGHDAHTCSACDFGEKCGEAGYCEVDDEVCSTLNCLGCCKDNVCLWPSEMSWTACGTGGQECNACDDYGVVCGDAGECTDTIAEDSTWTIRVESAEAFSTNTSGDWDFDSSAPEIFVCLFLDGLQKECTATAPEGYSATFDFDGIFTTLLSGADLASGNLSLRLFDEDVGSDDAGGEIVITATKVPVTSKKFSGSGSAGFKSVTITLQ